MWMIILVLLLLGAHLNLAALVPLQSGQPGPPWWVGGRLIWPYAVETHTLIPAGELLSTLTPLLAIAAALCFLLAAAALLRRLVPTRWFAGLVLAGAVFSIPLQIIWFTGWAVLPLLVDGLLLWAVFGRHLTVSSLRAEMA